MRRSGDHVNKPSESSNAHCMSAGRQIYRTVAESLIADFVDKLVSSILSTETAHRPPLHLVAATVELLL